MPLVNSAPRRASDKSELRRILSADRDWALYALADLDDGLFEQCEWWIWGESLALVFRGISITPIFVLGDAAATRELLAALPAETGYLNLREEQLAGARDLFRYRECHAMRRMMLDEPRPCRAAEETPGRIETLAAHDLAAVRALYATGDGGGIAFAPAQLDTGFFRGILRDGALVAVAGVQVASRGESVAAVGNVFTHPRWRGQGLAQTTTWAVVEALQAAGIATIGLNVNNANGSAIHAYEKLGFRTRLRYQEGMADRVARRPGAAEAAPKSC